jgi:hypothetical protein
LKTWTIIGNPEEVARRLGAYNDVGVSYHIMNFATKVRDEERIELFAHEVLPALLHPIISPHNMAVLAAAKFELPASAKALWSYTKVEGRGID